MTKTRIAVIGAGLIGRKHVDVVARHAKLAAVIDPSSAARDLARDRGVPWFADVHEGLEAAKPDGAIVATPNQLHLDHGRACVDAGIPALIEKPLAEGTASAQVLVDAADLAGVPVLVGHHRRHSPLVRQAKAALDAGRLGRIVHVTAQFWLYKPEDYFDMAWRREKGAGPTFINLIHDIDLLRYFCGEICQVQAFESNAVRGFDVEDSSAVILRFANGALGTVSISDTVVAPWSWELTAGENPAYPKTDMACYTIGGTAGSLSVPDLHLWRHEGDPNWWNPIGSERLECVADDPVEQQFLHFLDVIAGRSAPLVSALEGLKNLQVLDAIKQAAQSGRVQCVGD